MFQLKTTIFFVLLTIYVCGFSQTDKNSATYNKTIKVADSIYATGDIEAAKGAYFYASKLMPNNSYALQQISRIEKQLSETVNKKIDFEKVVNHANKLLSEGNKVEAQAKFEEALAIMENSDARSKLNKINSDIAQEKAILEQYQQCIEKANKELFAEQYYEAVQKCNEAAKIKPDEKTPANTIKNIQLRVIEEYGIHDSIVTKGDKLYDVKEFRKALFMYKTALVLMPNNKATQTKYRELANIVDYYTDLKTQFDQAVSDGDKAMALKNFRGAEVNFAKAIDIFPDEKYPNDQLSIAKKMAFNHANLDKLFKESIAAGDAILATGNLEKALEQYRAAENLKPDQVKNKITSVENRLASAKLLVEQYSKYIVTADTLFNTRRFGEALDIYKSAMSLKSKEIEIRKGTNKSIDESFCLISTTYTEKRIIEAEGVIAIANKNYNEKKEAADKEFANRNLDKAKTIYEEAIFIRPQDAYTLGQIKTIVAMQQADINQANADYESLLNNANQFITNEQYEEALVALNTVKTMRPDNSAIDTKIGEVKVLLSTAKEREEKYNTLITEANEAFASNALEVSKTKYEEALTYKPKSAIALSRINTINERIELLKNREKNYANAIKQGDSYFDNKDYEAAFKQYSDAIALKPEEKYPADKLKVVQNEIDILVKVNNEYKLYVKEADFLFDSGEYTAAIGKYSQAQLIKPTETYPQAQITLSTSAIEKIDAEATRKAEEIALEAKMQAERIAMETTRKAEEAVLEAKRHAEEIAMEAKKKEEEMARQKEELALEAKRQAEEAERQAEEMAIKAEEERLASVIATDKRAVNLTENTILSLNTKKIELIKGTSIKLEFKTLSKTVRENSLLVMKAENIGAESNVRIVLNFGFGYNLNGGVLVNLLAEKGQHYYIIDLTAESGWVNKDNNWITLLGENGNISIDEIKIVEKQGVEE